jgi:hypothetical protein
LHRVERRSADRGRPLKRRTQLMDRAYGQSVEGVSGVENRLVVAN